MNNEQKFWISCWTIVGAVTISIVAAFCVSDILSVRAIERMVKNGANPIAARCAVMGAGERGQVMCNNTLNK